MFHRSHISISKDYMPRSLYYCLFAPHIWVLFFAHIPFVVNCTFNTTPMERLRQHPLLFTTNFTNRTFFLWGLHLPRRSHPGHSTTLLRSEIPSRKCTKLHTVAASKNRDHLTISLSSLPSGSRISGLPGSKSLSKVTHQDHSITIILCVCVASHYVQSFTC